MVAHIRLDRYLTCYKLAADSDRNMPNQPSERHLDQKSRHSNRTGRRNDYQGRNRDHDRGHRRSNRDHDAGNDEIVQKTIDGYTYYIIPNGMDVIFQDEHGKEITRYAAALVVD
jgi:hypothetical protein